jgi:dTDP-4-dehydrorhamnose reductase
MQKIVILGVGGMAGHVISLTLRKSPELFQVLGVARKTNVHNPDFIIDLTDRDKLRNFIETQKPDFVVNAAGILNECAEKFPEEAILINSYLPHFLERITENTSCKIIHISTDCVFSGKKGGYVEEEFKDGKGYYAQSKALGEIVNCKDLTIRTSIIGPELNPNGIGLFNWFSKQQGEVNGYAKAFWTGVTTLELARAINHVIENKITGLYHLVNNEKISKYSLLQLLLKHFSKSEITKINYSEQYIVDKSLINTRTMNGYSVPDYEAMIVDLKCWIKENSNLYPHYNSLL